MNKTPTQEAPFAWRTQDGRYFFHGMEVSWGEMKEFFISQFGQAPKETGSQKAR